MQTQLGTQTGVVLYRTLKIEGLEAGQPLLKVLVGVSRDVRILLLCRPLVRCECPQASRQYAKCGSGPCSGSRHFIVRQVRALWALYAASGIDGTLSGQTCAQGERDGRTQETCTEDIYLPAHTRGLVLVCFFAPQPKKK